MRFIAYSQHALGRNGPELLVVALLTGAIFAPAIEFLQFLLPAAAFFLTLGSFVSAGLSKPEATGVGRTVISLAWILVLYPALAMLALSVAGLEPALTFGMLLAIVAPPIGSAAAISAMLEMRPRLALILSIAPTVAAPWTIPIGLALFGSPVSIDLLGLIVRLTVIIGSAAVISAFVLRFRHQSLRVIPDATAATGLSVIGLVLVGLLAAAYARLFYELDPGMFATTMVDAFALNIAGCVIGAAVYAVWGREEALTLGLVTGNRNVTLAWAIAGSAPPQAAETFVIAAVIPRSGITARRQVSPCGGPFRLAPPRAPRAPRTTSAFSVGRLGGSSMRGRRGHRRCIAYPRRTRCRPDQAKLLVRLMRV